MQNAKIFYGWWIVAACFVLCFLFAGAGFYSFSIFIKPLENEFGWGRADISLTMSIHFILGGLVGPLVGKLTQAYGSKKVMTFGAIGAGLCFMLVSLTQSLWYFYMIYAVLALMLSGIGIIPVSSLLANWFHKRRGTATGVSLMGISAGGLLLAPVLSLIAATFGWKASYLFLGLLVWVIALPVICFVIKGKPAVMGLAPDGENREGPFTNAENSVSSNDSNGWPSGAALRSRAFWCISASFFLAPLAQLGILQHQVPLISGTGVTEATAAMALGLTAGIGGLGKMSFGRIFEIIRFRYVVTLCFGLQALAVFLLLYIHSTAIIWVYVVIFGFAMGGVVVLIPLAVGHFFGLVSFGFLLGILWMVNALGGAMGTYTSGWIYDFSGSYDYALYAFIVAYIAAIFGLFLAGEPRPYRMDGKQMETGVNPPARRI
jgi:sugar phosphate permease